MESPVAVKGGGLSTAAGRSSAAAVAANFMARDATLPTPLARIRDLIGSGAIGRRFIELIKSSPMGGEAEALKLKVTSP